MVKLCFEFALELDEVTTEKQMIRTGGCGQGCVGECDLPDQYSDQPKLIVTEATKQIRPFAVTADWDARLGHAEGTILHDAKAPKDIKFVLLNQANVYIGIDESAEALAKMLNRLFPTTQNASKQLEVLIPPTRHDMLHVCDIEDVGAYDYNRIPKTLPATMHIARQCPLNKLTKQLREQISQAGFTEGLTLTLCSRDDIAG
ncbi:hypothetical protein pipiens_014033 [Culex pipiens pipiens]|uniref:B5 domain-containing protein n=1 Tax=Culex pipiens pipiens TaxID=38569 RepID=A0ABD1CX96_CULPP